MRAVLTPSTKEAGREARSKPRPARSDGRRAPASCTLLAGGDIAISRARARGALGRLAPLFREAGVAFANLELPLSRRGRPAPEKILLRGAPEMDEALAEAGFGALAFANNHALDYGEEAFFETIALMAARSIPLVGAGEDLAGARRPVVLERGGLRVGLLAYSSVLPRGFAAGAHSPGVAPLRALTSYRTWRDLAEYPGTPPEIRTWADPGDLRAMARDIRTLRRRADVLIVNHHWGTSMVHEVRDFQREIARAAVDAGADLVLGGHPHVLQGVEFYQEKPIVYSMGNLVFDFDISFFTEATHQTFLFGCALAKGAARDPYLIPCAAGVRKPPALLSPRSGEGREILRLMERLNKPFGTKMKFEGGRARLMPPK